MNNEIQFINSNYGKGGIGTLLLANIMTIRNTIQTWCDSTTKALVKSYDEQDRRASGAWAESLENQIQESKTGYKISFLAAYYTYWMERGRKPSAKFPPIDAIRKWIEAKGILADGISLNSLAFLIARKIAREGYKGRPVVENVFTTERIRNLMDSMGYSFTSEMKSAIIKDLKTA